MVKTTNWCSNYRARSRLVLIRSIVIKTVYLDFTQVLSDLLILCSDSVMILIKEIFQWSIDSKRWETSENNPVFKVHPVAKFDAVSTKHASDKSNLATPGVKYFSVPSHLVQQRGLKCACSFSTSGLCGSINITAYSQYPSVYDLQNGS